MQIADGACLLDAAALSAHMRTVHLCIHTHVRMDQPMALFSI